MGIATGIPVTFLAVVDGTDGVGGVLDAATTLLSESDPPQVFSSSYLFNEDEFTSQVALAE